MNKVTVVLPTYNEKEGIVRLLRSISKVLQKTKRDFEILVVDDNSPDGTQDEIRKHQKRNKKVRLIVRLNNRGLSNSIKRGVKESKGEVIVGMDADGNHDPATLPQLLEKLNDHELVVASRFVKGGGMKNLWRLVPTFCFNAAFRWFGLPIWDNTSGYYAIRKADLKKLGINKIYYGYGDYHLRLVYGAKTMGYRIVEVPTRYQERLGGASKSRLLNMAWDYFREAWRLSREGSS